MTRKLRYLLASIVIVVVVCAARIGVLEWRTRQEASAASAAPPAPPAAPGPVAYTQLDMMLDRRIPDIRGDKTPLETVIDLIRGVSGLKIEVDWKTLESAGVNRQTLVTSRLRDIKVSKALTVILADFDLAWRCKGSVIQISTRDVFDRDLVVRQYDCHRLTSPERAEELEKEIIELICETVDRESWKRNGGTIGDIAFVRGWLVVRHTEDRQAQVQNLINMLHESR